MSNMQLRQNVMDELEFEPSVDAAHIGVAADNGIITLSGHVSSYAQKLAAEQAVRRVKGVRGIAEEIEVRYPNDKKTADDEIATRVLNILRWNAVAPADKIQVKVQNGWVTLTGEVDWQFQRMGAESHLRKLSGVAGVINDITLKPRVQSQDVKAKIEAALRRNAQIEAERIRVRVNEGRVLLEGEVHDWQERYSVENAAWSVPGVTSVEDKLAIAQI